MNFRFCFPLPDFFFIIVRKKSTSNWYWKSYTTQPDRTLFSFKSIWTRPQGLLKEPEGHKDQYLALIFSPNWTNFEKPHKIKKIYQKWLFCDGFSNFVECGLNISAKTHQVIDLLILPGLHKKSNYICTIIIFFGYQIVINL